MNGKLRNLYDTPKGSLQALIVSEIKIMGFESYYFIKKNMNSKIERDRHFKDHEHHIPKLCLSASRNLKHTQPF